MPRSADYAKVELEAAEEPDPLAVPASDTPFRILLMGDFSGRGSRGISDPTLKGRRPVLVDRDNFDQVMERLQVELPSIRFAELDDFHPDRLYEQLPVFRTLRDTRKRLADRATFAAAAAEVRAWSPPKPAPAPPAAPPPAPDLGRLSPEQLFARMLEESAPQEVPLHVAPDPFETLLRDIVAPYVEPKPDPRQGELVAQVDETTGGQMRAILHHPEFQALEAAWRGVFFLVRRLETDANLKLYLLDVTRAELAACAAGDLTETGLYEIVVEQSVGTPGAPPWAVLAADFTFSGAADDVVVLRELGRLARAAGAPLLAAASTRILGCASLAATPDPRAWHPEEKAGLLWSALRHVPEAAWVGLATPRFLMRLPYGGKTDATERFDFEEMPGTPDHQAYLWGNPVFACLCLLGQGFAESGWDFRPDAYHEIDGLPAHLYKDGPEMVLKPCAEALLTERAAQAIMDKGLMALVTMKDSDRVRLLRFQCIADPPAGLPGRWA